MWHTTLASMANVRQRCLSSSRLGRLKYPYSFSVGNIPYSLFEQCMYLRLRPL